MEQQISISLDENLKRIVSKALQVYRNELQTSAKKANQILYRAIVDEEVSWIEQLLAEIKRKWEKITVTETWIYIHPPLLYKKVIETLESVRQNPSQVINGMTSKGEKVEVKYHSTDDCFEILKNGAWICITGKNDWAAHVFISLLD